MSCSWNDAPPSVSFWPGGGPEGLPGAAGGPEWE